MLRETGVACGENARGAERGSDRISLGGFKRAGVSTPLYPDAALPLGGFHDYWRNYVRRKMAKVVATQQAATIFKEADLALWLANRSDGHQIVKESPLAVDEHRLLPREHFVAHDKNGAALCCYIPSCITPAVHEEAHASLEEFYRAYPPRLLPKKKKEDKRHPACSSGGSYHMGVWQGTGALKETISREVLGSDQRISAVAKLLSSPSMQKMQLMAGGLFSKVDPTKSLQYRKAMSRMGPAETAWWTICPTNATFPMVTVVANQQVELHRDLKDVKDGWCCIMCVGDFEGGNTCLPDLGVRLPFAPGDCLFIRSFALHHFVAEWKGKSRYTVVSFMHQFIFDGTLVPQQGRKSWNLEDENNHWMMETRRKIAARRAEALRSRSRALAITKRTVQNVPGMLMDLCWSTRRFTNIVCGTVAKTQSKRQGALTRARAAAERPAAERAPAERATKGHATERISESVVSKRTAKRHSLENTVENALAQRAAERASPKRAPAKSTTKRAVADRTRPQSAATGPAAEWSAEGLPAEYVSAQLATKRAAKRGTDRAAANRAAIQSIAESPAAERAGESVLAKITPAEKGPAGRRTECPARESGPADRALAGKAPPANGAPAYHTPAEKALAEKGLGEKAPGEKAPAAKASAKRAKKRAAAEGAQLQRPSKRPSWRRTRDFVPVKSAVKHTARERAPARRESGTFAWISAF